MARIIQHRKYVVPQPPGYIKVNRFFRVEQDKMEELIDKQMKAERWMKKIIGYYDRDRVYHREHTFDFPVHFYEKYDWVVRWRKAKTQCKYPHENIEIFVESYILHDKIVHDDTSPYKQLRSAKAWLTRARKAQQQYELHKRQTLFSDYKNDPKWQMLRRKVKQKEHKLRGLQQQFDSYVESKRKLTQQ